MLEYIKELNLFFSMKKIANIIQFDALNQWYNTPLGLQVLKHEITNLSDELPELFGYYLVQLGGPDNDKILTSSTINNKIILNKNIELSADKSLLSNEKVDVIVAMHALECTTTPNILLDQIYNALVPNGHLIVFSLNPYSKLGIKSLLGKNKLMHWLENWINPGRMRALLKKHDFTVLGNPKQLLDPYFEVSYMLVAQKITMAPAPITKHVEVLPAIAAYGTLATREN